MRDRPPDVLYNAAVHPGDVLFKRKVASSSGRKSLHLVGVLVTARRGSKGVIDIQESTYLVDRIHTSGVCCSISLCKLALEALQVCATHQPRQDNA